MGSFVITIAGTGNHGCERQVKEGEHVLGCQRPDCVDCIAREVVRRLKRNGTTQLRAELVHWPTLDIREGEGGIPFPEGNVTDDLVTGIRRGSF